LKDLSRLIKINNTDMSQASGCAKTLKNVDTWSLNGVFWWSFIELTWSH